MSAMKPQSSHSRAQTRWEPEHRSSDNTILWHGTLRADVGVRPAVTVKRAQLMRLEETYDDVADRLLEPVSSSTMLSEYGGSVLPWGAHDAERIAADVDPSWSRSGYALTPLELAAAQSSADARRRAAVASRSARRKVEPKPWSPKGAWKGVVTPPSASASVQTDDAAVGAMSSSADEQQLQREAARPLDEDRVTSALRRAAIMRTVSRVDRLAVAEDVTPQLSDEDDTPFPPPGSSASVAPADASVPPSALGVPAQSVGRGEAASGATMSAAAIGSPRSVFDDDIKNAASSSHGAGGLWLGVPSLLPTAANSRRHSVRESNFSPQHSRRQSTVTVLDLLPSSAASTAATGMQRPSRAESDRALRSSVIDEIERLITPAATPRPTSLTPPPSHHGHLGGQPHSQQPAQTQPAQTQPAQTQPAQTQPAHAAVTVSALMKPIQPAFDATTQTQTQRDAMSSRAATPPRGQWASDDDRGTTTPRRPQPSGRSARSSRPPSRQSSVALFGVASSPQGSDDGAEDGSSPRVTTVAAMALRHPASSTTAQDDVPPASTVVVSRRGASQASSWGLATELNDTDTEEDARLRDELFSPAAKGPQSRRSASAVAHDEEAHTFAPPPPPVPSNIEPILDRIHEMRRQLLERQGASSRALPRPLGAGEPSSIIPSSSATVPPAPHTTAMQLGRLTRRNAHGDPQLHHEQRPRQEQQGAAPASQLRGTASAAAAPDEVSAHARNFFELRDQFFQSRDTYRSRRARDVAQVTFAPLPNSTSH